MRIKETWIVKTMDNIAEAVCGFSQSVGEFLLNCTKITIYFALVATAAVWVIPYILLKRVAESINQRRNNYEPAATQGAGTREEEVCDK